MFILSNINNKYELHRATKLHPPNPHLSDEETVEIFTAKSCFKMQKGAFFSRVVFKRENERDCAIHPKLRSE